MDKINVMPRLKHLVIKPILKCNQHCPYCVSRKVTFSKSSEAILGVKEWSQIFREADQLGTEYLDISGGEPTMYSPLPALVWEAKQYGWYVSMNTNGSYFTREFLLELEDVYLDQVIVSLISLDSQTNDIARKSPGGLDRAINAIRLLRNSPIRCVVHCIVSRYNDTDIPNIIEFAFNMHVNALALVYPENDYGDNNLLMTSQQIKRFREQGIPKAMDTYRRCYKKQFNTEPPAMSVNNLKNLYNGQVNTLSKGIYFSSAIEAVKNCQKPYSFLLIYANGDVLPCNGVEYTGEPLVGNVREQSLREIWNSTQMILFQEERMEFCKYCPVPHHTGIAIKTIDNPPYAAPVVKNVRRERRKHFVVG